MNFNEYQKKAERTDTHVGAGGNDRFFYAALGLAGEAGEVAEKMKKILRDHGGTVDAARREEMKRELGDVLWYLAKIAREFDIPLDDVAEANIEKLYSRMERGKLHGDGDTR